MTGTQRIKVRLKRRELRKSRGLCEKCSKRQAKYKTKYKRWIRKSRKLPFIVIRKDKAHKLCLKCFESVLDSVRKGAVAHFTYDPKRAKGGWNV